MENKSIKIANIGLYGTLSNEEIMKYPPIYSFIGGYPVTKLWCEALGEYITMVDYPNTL